MSEARGHVHPVEVYPDGRVYTLDGRLVTSVGPELIHLLFANLDDPPPPRLGELAARFKIRLQR